MVINFTMLAGAAQTGAANTWLAGNFVAATGQINAGSGPSTDFFRIAGVVVLPGLDAPTAARSPFIMRPYDQELVTCERYFQKYIGALVGGGTTNAAGIYNDFILTTPMRAAPAVTLSNGVFTNSATLSVNSAAANHIRFALNVNASSFGYVIFDYTADARL
jgi:hypothetical protein